MVSVRMETQNAIARMFGPVPVRLPSQGASRIVVAGRNIVNARKLPQLPDAADRAALKDALRKQREHEKYKRSLERGGRERRAAWTAANRAKIAAYKKWYDQQPGNQERQREQKRDHMRRKMADPAMRAQVAVRAKTRYAADPEKFREAARQYQKKVRADPVLQEQRRQASREHRALPKVRERTLAYQRTWRLNNIDEVRTKERERSARRRAAAKAANAELSGAAARTGEKA